MTALRASIYAIAIAIGLSLAMGVAAADRDGESLGDDGPRFHQGREDGWFWYKDPPPPPKPPKDAKEPPPSPVAAKPADPLLTQFERYKEALTQARIKAFFEPTPENVARYAELQTDLVRRSSDVSDVWQRVVWANPQFDFTQERPVTRLGLDAYEANAAGLKRSTFDALAASSVIYFFFRSDCPYCHQFAPTLARFSQATGIKVFPVTLDGGNLPDFPYPQRDNGMAANLNVTSWPAVFLGEPAKRQITPSALA
jgi:conjugal transfer pilus assembly protein TraF